MPLAAIEQDDPIVELWRQVWKPGDPCILLVPGSTKRDKPAQLRGWVEQITDGLAGARVLVRLKSGLRCWAGIEAVRPRSPR